MKLGFSYFYFFQGIVSSTFRNNALRQAIYLKRKKAYKKEKGEMAGQNQVYLFYK
ncbi:MAG: hypothetical protein MRERV_38c003 [Mycoplasmataceae bacterium RV_VA103A]|nr:MAG: hypothetical protein MRERV_38c003 [Mycoplasmataceae bacterium RV_VA103A]